MKINNIARAAIADKVQSAIKREGLTKGEAAILLDSKGEYISKLLNPSYRIKMRDSFFAKFIAWGNSGDSIRAWGKKNSPEAIQPAPEDSIEKYQIPKREMIHGAHQPVVDNTTDPPKKEFSPDYEFNALDQLEHNLQIEQAINEIREVAKKFGVSEEELRAIFTPMGSQDKIGPAETVKTNRAPYLNEIAELLEEKLSKQPDILLATTEATDPGDRLEVILAVINELKGMGFDVSICISPKDKSDDD